MNINVLNEVITNKLINVSSELAVSDIVIQNPNTHTTPKYATRKKIKKMYHKFKILIKTIKRQMKKDIRIYQRFIEKIIN